MRLRAVIASVALLVGLVTAGHASAATPGPERGIAVLGADTGDVRWTRTAADGLTFQGGTAGTGVVIATERTCKEGEDDGDPEPVLRAFDSARASLRWSTPGYGVATRPMIWGPVPRVDVGANGVVVVGGGRYGPDVRGVALRSGKPVWTAGPESHELGVSSSLVFAAVDEGPSSVLRASSRRTGREAFAYPAAATAGDPAWTDDFDVVAADAHTVVVANGGYFGRSGSEALEPTTFFVLEGATGEELSRFDSADPRLTFSGVAMGHGLLVFSER
ncbi:MAG TPA: hypothetical protein VHS03_16120, partial [Gaiellaceae bacterium]|nr:hypothetical protein [Gaiellaceae bacterium]